MTASPRTTHLTHSLRGYATESKCPLVSLVFMSPLLLIYELGIVLLGPHAMRNGADTWLRHLLEFVGFGQYLLLPILTCGILLGWHHTRHDNWSLRGPIFTAMLFESLLFAALLFGLAHAHHAVFARVPAAVQVANLSPETAGMVSRLIGYCGAGIYEELLFRLMLLPAAAAALHWSGLPWRSSWAWSIVATSLIFSAAHYDWITPGGYPFDWYSFSFRFAAGTFFAIVFVTRGFGIAAGSHAFYDMLVEIAHC